MGNPISDQLTLGTIAELLVQASLLQFDVQAAPPLKDSGNDLIAIRRAAIRAIQVKATKRDRYGAPKEKIRYDILAAVRMRGNGRSIHFDRCEIFLLQKSELRGLPRSFDRLPPDYLLSKERIDLLFPGKRPNKAPEPTTMAVTPRATSRIPEVKPQTPPRHAARGAPATVVAHL